MNQKRMGRVSQEIKKCLSTAIKFDLRDPRISEMTSLTDVTISSDLSYCDIYVSVLGKEWDKKQTLEGLDQAGGYLKKMLADQIDLRQIPELRFHLDESIERGMKMDALIAQVIAQDQAHQKARAASEEAMGEDGPSDEAQDV